MAEKTFNPFQSVIRGVVRLRLRRLGYDRSVLDDAVELVNEDLIELASLQSDIPILQDYQKIGDGTIIQAILEFLKSEQGKKLIDAILTIILSLL